MSAITPRKLLASTAVAVVFASQAGAAGLLEDKDAYNVYHGNFPTALRQVAKDNPNIGAFAGAAMYEIDSKLKNRTGKPLTAMYPTPVSPNQLFVAALIAPQGMEQADIPVCAEQNSKVVGLWNIAANGAVTPVTNWTGPVVPDAPNGMACKAFIVAARNDINAKYAAMQQQKPSAEATKPQVLGMAPQQ